MSSSAGEAALHPSLLRPGAAVGRGVVGASSRPALPAAGRRPWSGPWGSEVVDGGRSRASISWPRAGGRLPGEHCGQVRALLALGGGTRWADAFTS